MPIAYDVGGVTTSTVTVPVVAALGLGLASAIPGRSPLIDGFGLIAFTCLCPIMTVLAYATVADRWPDGVPAPDGRGGETRRMNLKLIVAFVAEERTEAVLDAARAAGATGATVITHARGEGLKPEKTFFGLELTAQRDMLLFLVAAPKAREILETIAAGRRARQRTRRRHRLSAGDRGRGRPEHASSRRCCRRSRSGYERRPRSSASAT